MRFFADWEFYYWREINIVAVGRKYGISKIHELWTTALFQDTSLLLVGNDLQLLLKWPERKHFFPRCPPLSHAAVSGATTNTEPTCLPQCVCVCECVLTFHSRACSTAGGPCSNRSRWARSNTRRTWRRSRARSARSRAAGSGRRWDTRSPHTTLPLPCTPDLEGGTSMRGQGDIQGRRQTF